MKTDAMSDAGSLHLLLYPAPSSGHIIPLLDLTQRLLSRGVTVTVLITPTYRHLLQPLLSRHVSSLQALVLPAPVDPSSGNHPLVAVITAMRDHHSPEILRWFAAHPSPPAAIVSDFFLGWTHHLARQLGVPRVVFSPSAAAALSVDFSLWGGDEIPTDVHSDDVIMRDVPNSPSFPRWQLSPLYRSFIAGDSSLQILKDCVVANMESWGVVFNSFTELEQVYLEHMKVRFGSGRVWAVGPLIPDDSAGSTDRGGSSSVAHESVLTWLDSRKTNSVVYVCFGSRMVLTDKETVALAAALEMSGVHFIWSTRGPVSERFRNRVSGRGLVITGWAPQVAILRHGAVGSFVTHCGWNSVLEGIVNGVVMLTWPMAADQYMNARLLVDQLGVGIRAWEGPEGTAPEPIELARVLAHSVDENIIPERRKAKELSEAAAAATAPGGSLGKDLDGFIAALSELKPQRELGGSS